LLFFECNNAGAIRLYRLHVSFIASIKDAVGVIVTADVPGLPFVFAANATSRCKCIKKNV